jgi:hypothetical protein
MCTSVLLLGVAVDRWILREPSLDPTHYHSRVKAEAARIPLHFANWLGADVPVPNAATQMLKPNVLLSRRYQQLSTDQSVTVLLVQCADARDIQGHYPPVCYPGQGWALVSSEPREWNTGRRIVLGMRYVFRTGELAESNETTIDNFMLLPDGRTARTMDDVRLAAADRRRRLFGAAQVQIVYGANLTEQQRLQVFHTFLEQLNSTISAIAGEDREQS